MSELDVQNADFWDELCGSLLARELGITDGSAESLRRFDEAYFGIYPYLMHHLQPIVACRGRTLEIGLGFGTIGEFLARTGVDYHGLDIAQGPVHMLRGRLARSDSPSPSSRSCRDPRSRSRGRTRISTPSCQSGACITPAISPARFARFIGSLSPVAGTRDGLQPQLAPPIVGVRPRAAIDVCAAAPTTAPHAPRTMLTLAGEPAPFTEFTSARGASAVFAVQQGHRRKENMDPLARFGIPREKLLGWPARVLGLDLYVTAVK